MSIAAKIGGVKSGFGGCEIRKIFHIQPRPIGTKRESQSTNPLFFDRLIGVDLVIWERGRPARETALARGAA